MKTLQFKQQIFDYAHNLERNRLATQDTQFTDFTITNLFIIQYKDIIRYCWVWNKFLIWNGCNWDIDNDGRVQELLIDFIQNLDLLVSQFTDHFLALSFMQFVKKVQNKAHIDSCLQICKMSSDIKIKQEYLDDKPNLINTKDCTINLDTMESYPNTPLDYITKSVNATFLSTQSCPLWLNFISTTFNHDDNLIHYVQKACGYALSGSTSSQCMFVLWGSGSNGKSTFLNTLQYVLGDYAGSSGTDTFTRKNSDQTNDIARLKGLRLVTTSEIEQGKAFNESLIKQLTGQDKITARFLYSEYFTFTPTFKIFMATNHKPRIKGSDNGIWRRIKLIPFNITIRPEDRDKDLASKLCYESSGILLWLLQGYYFYKTEGLVEPECIVKATAEYRAQMDNVSAFLAAVCETAPDYITAHKVLYEAYCSWCSENEERSVSSKTFGMRLDEMGFVRKNSNSVRSWIGVGLS